MPVTEQTYQRVALEDPEGLWKLHRGRLRSKSTGTSAHNQAMSRLGGQLMQRLDPTRFEVRINAGRLRRSAADIYLPDVFVVPVALTLPLLDQPDALEAYADPVPLVVEVWDPPTDEYDGDTKIPEYEHRGDTEIWRLHPYDRSLLAAKRQPDGSYEITEHRGGNVRSAALEGVAIDLDVLWRGRSRSEPDAPGLDR